MTVHGCCSIELGEGSSRGWVGAPAGRGTVAGWAHEPCACVVVLRGSRALVVHVARLGTRTESERPSVGCKQQRDHRAPTTSTTRTNNNKELRRSDLPVCSDDTPHTRCARTRTPRSPCCAVRMKRPREKRYREPPEHCALSGARSYLKYLSPATLPSVIRHTRSRDHSTTRPCHSRVRRAPRARRRGRRGRTERASRWRA